MKNFLLTAVIAASAAMPVMAGTALPYSETFDTAADFATMTVVDANSDNKTWYHSDYYKSAMIDYSDDSSMDDWLILPAFSLAPGGTYTFEMDARCYSSFLGTERFEVKMGTAATAAAMTETVVGETLLKTDKFQHFTQKITVATAGTYYIGIHCISDAERRGMLVDNIALSAGVAAESPAAVTDLTLTPEPTGLNKVTVAFTAPARTSTGVSLTALDKVEIYRDKALIKAISPVAPGQPVTFVDETVTAGNHSYMAVAYSATGRGLEASADVFVGPGKPSAVGNFKVKETTPGDVEITWSAPTTDEKGNRIDPSLITYKVVSYEIVLDSYFTESDIVEGLADTRYVHHAIDAGKGQRFIAYGVYAETISGKSTAVKTALFPVGTNYSVPFAESFAGGKASSLWRSEVAKNQSTAPAWTPLTDEDVADLASRDGDGGYVAMLGENTDDSARYYSGKIDLSGLQNPVLSFYTFNFGNGSNNDDENVLEIYGGTGSGFNLIKSMEIKEVGEYGWNKVILPLTAYKDKVVQVVFTGVTKNYLAIPLDAITVGEAPARDLAAVSLSIPETVTTGQYFDIEVDVENAGTQSVGGYVVELYRNGEKIQEAEGPELYSCTRTQVGFSDRLEVIDNGDNEYYAKVVCEGDENPANNTTAVVKAVAEAPEYPVATNLKATRSGNAVTLTWTAPDLSTAKPEATTDSFEAYESFATQGVGGWTFTDMDNAQVGKFQGITFPGITYEGSVQSFWVMDASMEGANASFAAHSGGKYIAQIFNYDGSQCDDWAISPELKGIAQTVSFYAKSYSSIPSYAETFEVLYSTTDTSTDHFVKLGTYENVPNAWTRYDVALPEGAKHFAIRCVSEGCYMLFVDDVTFVAAGATHGLEVEGYNVYRNRQKITEQPVSGTQFVDTAAPDGENKYMVTVAYNKGESVPGNEVVAGEAGVEAVDGDNVAITALDGKIVVDGATAQTVIMQPNGAIVYTGTGSHVEAAVAQGVYIVKTGVKVTKVIVK